MLFSSVIFLFLFLPLLLALYYLSPNKLRNLVLLAASLLFYTWGENKLVLIMLLSTVVDYSAGLLIENGRKRIGLLLSILTNISLLGFYKYFNFTFENFNALLEFLQIDNSALSNLPYIALPIGISFYTFQTMSYTIDVYRGNVKANRNFIDFATYVTMFPQLIAGPIVRYADIAKQLKERTTSFEKFSLGVERFIIGLAKKVLIANTFASIADSVFTQEIHDLSTPYAWLGIIAYTLQIYFDFSGYSDMAIGLGKMLGFDFLENFNYPYIARSIREFWRRWHISLSTWFRDYLYISLGGNRLSVRRTYLNLFVVFFITGLWHGASWNFVLWGLFHGAFIVLERMGFDKKLESLGKPIQHAYTLLAVVIGWVIFRADTVGEAGAYLGKMFWYSSGDAAVNSYLSFFHLNVQNAAFMVIAIVLAMPVFSLVNPILLHPKRAVLRSIFFFVLFAITIVFLGADSYNPFIYFRF